MLHRKVNIFLVLTLVFVFIIYGDSQDHKQILLGVLFAFLITTPAFLFNWLTIDGAFSAGICGTIAYGIGGLTGAAVLLAFFFSSSIFSKNVPEEESRSDGTFRRNGQQVWANGFWLSIWFLIWFLSGIEAFFIAGITAIAATTADTWATEIAGNRLKSKTRLLTTREIVPAGTDGGVSATGIFASLVGAALIALIYFGLNPATHFLNIITIALAGFSGSLIDSYLGARFQYPQKNQKASKKEVTLFGIGKINIDNNFVNWLSSGGASALSLIAILIISL